jgi:hypothetical protein
MRPWLHRTVAALATASALSLLGAGLAARAQAAVDLAGTWYVLVHYTDDTTHDPKQMRWEDRIWVFERKGSDLLWREYPIVVFQDESGRFEKLGTNRSSRVVAAWEPNPGQLAQIASGLEYNTRGSKEKVLKGSDAAGWSSGAGARAQSANVISYVETWSVDDVGSNPVFLRLDSMGSSEDDVAEGRTEFRTESVEYGGAVLRGRFERDGTRHGTFRLMKTGDASITKGSGKTQQERMREAFMSNFGAALVGDASVQKELEAQTAGGKVDPATRNEVRKTVRESIEKRIREEGGDVQAAEPYTMQLVDRIEHLLIDEKKTPAEIEQMLKDGKLGP